MASLLYMEYIYILPSPQCTCAEFSSCYSGYRVAIEWLSSGYRVAIEWLPSGMGHSGFRCLLMASELTKKGTTTVIASKVAGHGPYVVMMSNGFTS